MELLQELILLPFLIITVAYPTTIICGEATAIGMSTLVTDASCGNANGTAQVSAMAEPALSDFNGQQVLQLLRSMDWLRGLILS